MSVLDLIKKLGEKESRITDMQFISPIFTNTTVATRIDGIFYKLEIPKAVQGWQKIQPVDIKRARIVAQADLSEIEQYLRHLDKLRITLVMRHDGVYHGVPDKANKYGLDPSELIPIYLSDDTVLSFDRVLVRCDGSNFWFERVDAGNDPAKSEYLRETLKKVMVPDKIKFPGLTFEEKLAYTLRINLDRGFIEDRKKMSLKEDVEFSGGTFVDFTERQDHYTVTYKVDGRDYTSYISKDPRHMVMSAGLCLSGGDKAFDLKSLVTVIREGQHRNLIHHYHLR